MVGTGLVFWNSCSRRWARLECGNRLRTRTFMETCCWRRRRRQPEGSQRREQQRRRRPDPCPHPGAGRAQPLHAPRGHSLVAGSRRVRGVAGGAWGGGGGGVGSLPGAGVQGDARRAAASGPAPTRRRSARSSLQLRLRAGPRPGRLQSWVSLTVSASTGLGSGGDFLAPLAPCLLSFECFLYSCRGRALRERSGCQSLCSTLAVQAGKVRCRPPPRAPGAVSVSVSCA